MGDRKEIVFRMIQVQVKIATAVNHFLPRKTPDFPSPTVWTITELRLLLEDYLFDEFGLGRRIR